ncbi:NF038129 family PEP-CTERM protein [Pseudoduganella sp. LjRoot289]|uniref:NF038129 family PEP-CTERM protein n=1 Tax=Pseudoduganella sp. LjRoot289 TaxID=3342314 RepID=UPI003ED1003F
MSIDIRHRLSSLLFGAALAFALAANSGMASATVVHVNIDTSNFGAASGYLDMQLSASAAAPLATAAVSNMVGFGSIDLNYGVSTTAGGYAFRNDMSNYLSHTVNFGGVLAFDLTLSGDYDPLTTYVSTFMLSAFDEAFSPLGAINPSTGSLAVFRWTHGVQGDGGFGVSVSDQAVTVLAEPSDWLLIAVGLAAMAQVSRRVRRRSFQSNVAARA